MNNPISQAQRILLWVLSLFIVAGLTLSSFLEQRRSKNLIIVPADDAQAIRSARDQIQAQRQVPINNAGLQDLERLSGIGPGLASRIIDYRKVHGPFSAPEDLLRVKGIGPATLDKIRDQLIF